MRYIYPEINIFVMNKKVVDALKLRFPGASDVVLAKLAEKLSKTVQKDEDVKAEVDKVSFQQVFELEKAEAIADYEQRHGLKDGVKTEVSTETKTEQPADDLDARISAAVAAALKPVTDELTGLKSEKIATSRKQQLTAALEKAPEAFKSRYEKDFARLTFKDDTDYATWLAEVKADADKQAESEVTKGAVFGRPVGGSGTVSKDKPTDAELEAVVGSF